MTQFEEQMSNKRKKGNFEEKERLVYSLILEERYRSARGKWQIIITEHYAVLQEESGVWPEPTGPPYDAQLCRCCQGSTKH